jgi:RNA polymerase sigma factor (TIGR02999 family)
MSDARDVTRILVAIRDGSPGAVDELYDRVYSDLRALAGRQLGHRPGTPTLGPTALVHETYLKLVDRSRISPRDRAHFFATAARAMRQIAVDAHRASHAEKRGGGEPLLDLAPLEALLGTGADPHQDQVDLLALDHALDLLDARNPRLRQVVELRFFAGFDVPEVAEILGASPRTVKRDWRIARAFLYRTLSEPTADGSVPEASGDLG